MDKVTESTDNMGAAFAVIWIGGTGPQMIDILTAFLSTTSHKFPAIHHKYLFKSDLNRLSVFLEP